MGAGCPRIGERAEAELTAERLRERHAVSAAMTLTGGRLVALTRRSIS